MGPQDAKVWSAFTIKAANSLQGAVCHSVIFIVSSSVCDERCSHNDRNIGFIYWSTCHRLYFSKLNNVILCISWALELDIGQMARGRIEQIFLIKLCLTAQQFATFSTCCSGQSSQVLWFIYVFQPPVSPFFPSTPLSPRSLKTKGKPE